jgi:coenzyme F420-0:L-glutamate ligase/coenzyme F420-1:gamma-L-glutamate ligase
LPTQHLELFALPNIPSVNPGDDLAVIIVEALKHGQIVLQPSDILIVSSKIISKAENRFVDLRTVQPSEEAHRLADETRKDPRLVEVVLQESVGISRTAPHVLIVTHRLGFTSANAGIDQSNVGSASQDIVLLLPQNPDASAQQLATQLEAQLGVRPAIVVSDTHGRPFRLGNINVAIGASGLPVLYDQRGDLDLYGRELQATVTALADEIAAAAGLVSGQADEGQPVVLMRGLELPDEPIGTARDMIRPAEQDLYLNNRT